MSLLVSCIECNVLYFYLWWCFSLTQSNNNDLQGTCWGIRPYATCCLLFALHVHTHPYTWLSLWKCITAMSFAMQKILKSFRILGGCAVWCRSYVEFEFEYGYELSILCIWIFLLNYVYLKWFSGCTWSTIWISLWKTWPWGVCSFLDMLLQFNFCLVNLC